MTSVFENTQLAQLRSGERCFVSCRRGDSTLHATTYSHVKQLAHTRFRLHARNKIMISRGASSTAVSPRARPRELSSRSCDTFMLGANSLMNSGRIVGLLVGFKAIRFPRMDSDRTASYPKRVQESFDDVIQRFVLPWLATAAAATWPNVRSITKMY